MTHLLLETLQILSLRAMFLFSNTIFLIYKFPNASKTCPLLLSLPTIIHYLTCLFLKQYVNVENNKWKHSFLVIGILMKISAGFFDGLIFEIKMVLLCVFSAFYSFIEVLIEKTSGNNADSSNQGNQCPNTGVLSKIVHLFTGNYSQKHFKMKIIEEICNFLFIILFNYRENEFRAEMGFYLSMKANIFLLTYLIDIFPKYIKVKLLDARENNRNRAEGFINREISHNKCKNISFKLGDIFKIDPKKYNIAKVKFLTFSAEDCAEKKIGLYRTFRDFKFLWGNKKMKTWVKNKHKKGNFDTDQNYYEINTNQKDIINHVNIHKVKSSNSTMNVFDKEKVGESNLLITEHPFINERDNMSPEKRLLKIIFQNMEVYFNKYLLILAYMLTNISEMYIYYIFVIRKISSLAIYFSIDAIFKLILISVQPQDMLYFLLFKISLQISLCYFIIRMNSYFFVIMMFVNGITSEILCNTFEKCNYCVKLYDFFVFMFVMMFIFTYGIGKDVSEFIFFSSVRL